MKWSYLVIPITVFLTAFIGSTLTDPNSSWYKSLKLPSFAPPGYVIGMVWTVIFILCAISLLIMWNKLPHNTLFWWIIGIFVVNAILNIGWSLLFFNQHLILASILEMILLEASTIAIIILAWPLSRLAAGLLLPYGAWVAFATYLAMNIYQLNK
ncbi:MAG: tryptophan-rich sensory protein [Candidatus Parcubacteria bacterium]|nr:tryptophan-rich sensory protein [Candidatus Parcubacteria bacterium]